MVQCALHKKDVARMFDVPPELLNKAATRDQTGDWEGCGPGCCRCHCQCAIAAEWRADWHARQMAITPEQWDDINARAKARAAALGWTEPGGQP